MRQRERQDDRPAPSTGASPQSGLDRARDEAKQFIAVGDDAINRALGNNDSEAFLRANSQRGGE